VLSGLKAALGHYAAMRAPLRNLRQPWLFVYYAVGFGALSYLVSHTSVGRAIFAGLLFAVLM
jgi:hypothetical protein